MNPTYADLAKLLYVEACFREALRLNPSVVQNVRDVGHDMVLSNKYLLRKGQRFIVNHIALHRDPEHWDQGVYGDPNKFNPERFMPGGPPRHPNGEWHCSRPSGAPAWGFSSIRVMPFSG